MNQPIVDAFISGILSDSTGLKKDFASGIYAQIKSFIFLLQYLIFLHTSCIKNKLEN
jgi:hypothetical protein